MTQLFLEIATYCRKKLKSMTINKTWQKEIKKIWKSRTKVVPVEVRRCIGFSVKEASRTLGVTRN